MGKNHPNMGSIKMQANTSPEWLAGYPARQKVSFIRR
jgi:hypothetical protein